ncbi:hypothetical protein [Azospirillum sp. sgz301742]
MSFRRLVTVAAFSFAALASASSFAQTFASSSSAMSFPAQLAEAKSTARTFNSATLDRTERFEVDKYITQAESLYGLGSEKQAKEFLDVARGRLRLSIMPWDMQLASGIGDQLRSLH